MGKVVIIIPLIQMRKLSLFFFNVYLFLRERERGRVRDRVDTESEAGSRLHVVSTEPDAGLKLTNVRS